MGINDRDNPEATIQMGLSKLIKACKSKFPNSTLYLPLVSYSDNLSHGQTQEFKGSKFSLRGFRNADPPTAAQGRLCHGHPLDDGMCQQDTASLDGLFKLNSGNGSNVGPTSKPQQGILNLSNYHLTSAEKSVLMKGLNFVPTPSSISKTPILRAATEFGRKIKLNYIFKNPNRTFIFDNRTREPFTNKSNWDPPNKMIPETILTKINQMENEIKELAITKEKPNCPPEEIKAIKKIEKETQYNHQKSR